MKKYLHCRLAVLLAMSLPPGSALAMPMPSLTGTWELTEADTLYADGHRVHGFGDHPQGRMMVDGEGRYVIEIYRVPGMNFVSGNKATGTEAEFRDAMMRNSVHYGHVMLDTVHHHIIFDVEHAVFPNWEGKRQVRDYMLEGDRLSYQVPASSTGDGTVAISEWRRLRN
ncbi:lipocalin-like domain-containing protein [Nguyenibacter vanlangensis]|uniref:Lipocalin-like domain-containing protein n=1 Tax=Nguyenibacter vanlangensis TaxID=1216886 RepID=A0ABZ3D0S8_9PROT